MPWRSAKQRRWAYATKQPFRKRWDRKYGTKPRGKKKKSRRR